MLIDGTREIERAIAAGVRPIEAFVCDELCVSPERRLALQTVRRSSAELFHVTPLVYAKLAYGDRDDGIVVVAETPRRSLNDLKLTMSPLVAIAEGIEKPGNMGAIMRSADATGLDAVIFADCRTDLFNPNTIRASLGTVFRENVCEATTVETLAWLRERKLRILAARPDAATEYTNADLSGEVAIVLGNEVAGLTDNWRSAGITPVKLPMQGIADSLNVSTTAAVLFYEAHRQRREKQ